MFQYLTRQSSLWPLRPVFWGNFLPHRSHTYLFLSAFFDTSRGWNFLTWRRRFDELTNLITKDPAVDRAGPKRFYNILPGKCLCGLWGPYFWGKPCRTCRIGRFSLLACLASFPPGAASWCGGAVYEPGPTSPNFTLVFLLLCPCFIFFGLILVITGLVDREVDVVGTGTSSCSTLNLTQEKTWIDKIPLFGLQIRMNWQDDILRKNS